MHSDPILRRLHVCVLAHVPAILWGSPGTGKTSRVAAYARATGSHYERWLLSRCEAIDLRPRTTDAKGSIIVSEPPERARAVAAAKAVLFFDELNRAPRETETAGLDLIDSSPEHVAVVVACNPPSRGQSARSLDAATANRFCHFDVVADHEAWARAQLAGWPAVDADFPAPSPDALAQTTGRARALVSAFVRSQPGDLDACPDNPVAAGRAWPSPRSWDLGTRLYAMALALGLNLDDAHALLAGCLGNGVALKFLAYVRDADLPDPEALLGAPKTYVPPQGRVDRTVAALSAVVGALQSKPLTADRWGAAWVLVKIVVEADQADAGMVAADLLLEMYKGDATKAGLMAPQKLMPLRLASMLVSAKAK